MHSQNLRNSKSAIRTAVRRISGLGLGLLAASLVACGTEDPEPTKPVTSASVAPVTSTPATGGAPSVSPSAAASVPAVGGGSNTALWDLAWPVLDSKCMLCHYKGLASTDKAPIPSREKDLARAAWEMNAVKTRSQIATDIMPPGGGLSVAEKKAIDDWAATAK